MSHEGWWDALRSHCEVALGSPGAAVVIRDVPEDGKRAKVTPSESLKVLGEPILAPPPGS